MISEGFAVLVGSAIRKKLVSSASESIKASRENKKDNENAYGIVKKEFLFRTPPGTSAFVSGGPTNGNVKWKTEDGRTLKEVESDEGGTL